LGFADFDLSSFSALSGLPSPASLLRLLEISQIRRRLILPGRHQVAVRTPGKIVSTAAAKAIAPIEPR
jgi:hypothetical protein